jgi:hypothetical protein
LLPIFVYLTKWDAVNGYAIAQLRASRSLQRVQILFTQQTDITGAHELVICIQVQGRAELVFQVNHEALLLRSSRGRIHRNLNHQVVIRTNLDLHEQATIRQTEVGLGVLEEIFKVDFHRLFVSQQGTLDRIQISGAKRENRRTVQVAGSYRRTGVAQ